MVGWSLRRIQFPAGGSLPSVGWCLRRILIPCGGKETDGVAGLWLWLIVSDGLFEDHRPKRFFSVPHPFNGNIWPIVQSCPNHPSENNCVDCKVREKSQKTKALRRRQSPPPKCFYRYTPTATPPGGRPAPPRRWCPALPWASPSGCGPPGR